jgi:tagatose 1,6-diphosphate aldolase
MFTFYEPGELVDDDLQLVLAGTSEADAAKGFVPAYKFKMTNTGCDEEIGEIHLRVGSTHRLEMYGGHIGYRVVREHRGHGYAARSVKLILPLARKHGLKSLWITCDPANIASRRTCERAGAKLIEVVDLPIDIDLYARGHRQGCRYRLDL